uniref:Uncharacterized protein n=1 Tax=Neospora caninum (strain Liverpool) TaxID=572307 RepID=A0A0F7UR65_NEOCL|nr:TPA: hypothetical protein BN1204_066150 [Neospora caninum Liverpool]
MASFVRSAPLRPRGLLASAATAPRVESKCTFSTVSSAVNQSCIPPPGRRPSVFSLLTCGCFLPSLNSPVVVRLSTTFSRAPSSSHSSRTSSAFATLSSSLSFCSPPCSSWLPSSLPFSAAFPSFPPLSSLDSPFVAASMSSRCLSPSPLSLASSCPSLLRGCHPAETCSARGDAPRLPEALRPQPHEPRTSRGRIVATPPSSQSCADPPTRSWSLLQMRAFSANPYKPKSREVFHPYVPAPEHLPPPAYTTAVLKPLQQFIPKEFYRDMRVDSLRDGVSLGSDFPWNVTHKYRFWRRRKYNIQLDDRFIRLSPITGVDYYPRLNVFAVQWREDGQHRIRWFRATYGLKRAMRAAENFRKTLEATGRVDNWRTARHLRQQMLERRQQLKLRKKRFAKISSGQF